MDNHPNYGKISHLDTNPATPDSTSTYVRSSPTKAGQLGRATPYSSNNSGDGFLPTNKPNYYQLAAWDSARRKEPIIFDGLKKIVLAVQMKLGEYEHPYEPIRKFVRANISNSDKLYRWISDITMSTLWSGFSVSETLWTYKLGPTGINQVWIDDLISYNPLHVQLKLNNSSRLTHGEKLPESMYLTGVWVPAPFNELGRKTKKLGPSFTGSHVRLPKGKHVYTAIGTEGNNPWGTSLLEPVLEYHLFKEAYRDMLAIALDRYGTPLVWVKVPNQSTNEYLEDLDGESRPKSLQEKVNEQLSDMRSESALVLTQIDKDHPVEIGALTTGNNFADAFTEAINMCDQNMLIGMGIPNLIVKDNNQGLGSSGSSERQVEMFHAFISSIYKQIVGAFLDQCILQLIQYNFDPRLIPDAYNPGSIKEKPLRWSETKTLIQGIETFTKLGYVSPEETQDRNYVREVINMPYREEDAPPVLAEVIRAEVEATKKSSDIQEETLGITGRSAKNPSTSNQSSINRETADE